MSYINFDIDTVFCTFVVMGINIDFQVYDSKDPRALIVIDTSNWAHISNDPSIIEIITPGFETPVKNYYMKNSVNVFHSDDLGLNCSESCEDSRRDLPDGIYEITVKGSPEKFNKTRKYLRTSKLQLKVDKLLIGLALECDTSEIKEKVSKLNEINLLIKSAEANVRYDNICTAQELLKKANKLVERINCNTCR